jgi:RHS repeat-associated protein
VNNKLVSATATGGGTVSYLYDASGSRVSKTVGSTTTWYIYGLAGELVAEYGAGGAVGSPQKEYGYRGGQMLVVYDSTETGNKQFQWLVQDQLGSTRMVVDLSGSLTGMKRHDYLPFGEELGAGVGIRTAGQGYPPPDDQVRQKFGGYERDSETGLDFAQNRYLSSTQGRFTSPDPTLLSVNGTNPQTWNRYAYVLNNPLQYIDPLGLWAINVQYEYYEEGHKRAGQVKRATVTFTKTSKDDNAASLLDQLGYKTTDKGYDKLLKQFDSKLGGADSIQASKLGGAVGDFFGVIENKLAAQKEYDRTHPNSNLGPVDSDYNDCSMTACRLGYPGQMAMLGVGGIGKAGNQADFGVDEADALNRNNSIPLGNVRVRDIIRYGIGDRRHFTNVMFTGDDGITKVFSRSGVQGRFEMLNIREPKLINGYGPITGSYRVP